MQPAAQGNGIEIFTHFSDWTGHNIQREWLVGHGEQPGLEQGTYEWTRMEETVEVPEGARRMTVYAGMQVATGSLLIDDLEMNLVKPKPPQL